MARLLVDAEDVSTDFSCEVLDTEEVYGTFQRLYLRPRESTSDGREAQRRANLRFDVGPMVPLYCFVTLLGGRGIAPFRAIDVSNGGISIVGPSRNAASLFPGSVLRCQLQVPSLGSSRALIMVRNVDDAPRSTFDDSQNLCRIAAEFNHLSRAGRDLISRCLVGPMTTNAVIDLARENLLHRNWRHAVDFRVVRSCEDDYEITASLSGQRICRMKYNSANRHLDVPYAENATLPQVMKELADQLEEQGNWSSLNRHHLRTAIDEWAAASDASVSLNSYSRGQIARHLTRTPHQARHPNVEWAEYAEAYDVMCGANPAYQDNLSVFREWLIGLDLQPNAQICDVGAGTGNYVVEMAKRFPQAVITHMDSDPIMNRTASKKYRAHGFKNINFDTCRVADAAIDVASLDLVVCVNALYSFPSAECAIKMFHHWLKPGGLAFLIDLGRPMDVGDWARFIVSSSVKNIGWLDTLSAFIKGRKAIGQNRRIRHEQDCGRYWMHSTEGFGSLLRDAGFSIAHLGTCYRGVCDLAICRR